MNKFFVIVFFLFIAAYMAMNFYAVGRVLFWMGLPLNNSYIIGTTLAALSFFIASALEQKFTHLWTNILYRIAAVWMGVAAILFFGVLMGEVLIHFFELQLVGLVVLVSCTLFSAFAIIIAQIPIVRYKALSGSVDVRIAVLTDLHIGPVHGKEYLRKVLAKVQHRKPAILLLPGDIVDGPGKLPEDLLTPFNELDIPIYLSWGNHEHYLGEKEVNRLLKPTKIIPLRNKSKHFKGMTIIGIDDSEERGQVKTILPGLAKKGYNILMYHRPDGLKDAKGIDLMLCGHTHAGQVFPFSLMVKMRFRHMYGWFKNKDTHLYVSSGAGTWGPPMRFGSRSEIVIIDVKK